MLEEVTLEIKRSEEIPSCIYIEEVCLKSSVKGIFGLISSVTLVCLKKGARYAFVLPVLKAKGEPRLVTYIFYGLTVGIQNPHEVELVVLEPLNGS